MVLLATTIFESAKPVYGISVLVRRPRSEIERRLSGHGGQVGSNTRSAVRSKRDLSGQPVQRDRTALLHGLGIDFVYSILSAT